MIRHHHGCIAFVYVRIYQLWEGALAYQICMLLLQRSQIAVLLFVRLAIGLLFRLLLLVGSGIWASIVAFTSRATGALGIAILIKVLSVRIFALLIKDCVINSSLLLWLAFRASRCIVLQLALAICLLKTRIIEPIQYYSLKLLSNESGSASWHFHEILCELFFVLSRRFAVFLSRCCIYSYVRVCWLTMAGARAAYLYRVRLIGVPTLGSWGPSVMVFGLLGHPRSHKGLWVRDRSSLLSAAATCHINCVIANASNFVAWGGWKVLMRVGIRCNGSLRF